jgi:hypothetical protein
MEYFFLSIICLIINMELADSQELKSYYFDSGKTDTICVSKSLKAKIIKQIEKLIYNIDQELRVYFDAGRIDELKKMEKSIELRFNKKNQIKKSWCFYYSKNLVAFDRRPGWQQGSKYCFNSSGW